MAQTTLAITSKNYSAWSLRGWLLVRLAGLPFKEKWISPDDPTMKAEILLLAPSIKVPCLSHDGIEVWDTLAIAEYLAEIRPDAGLLPKDRVARSHCRSICGEMHSGFTSLRSALPMNIKGHLPGFRVWERARNDIERVTEIWRECLERYGGPFLFGERPCMADAMYAPVVTRLLTYDVTVDRLSTGYCNAIMTMPEMIEWCEAARGEPDDIDDFDMEF